VKNLQLPIHVLFKDEVSALFKDISPVQHFCKGNNAVLLLGDNPLYLAFSSYIPKGTTTSLPSLTDSISSMGTKRNKVRVSIGEWVVENIYGVHEHQSLFIEKIKKGFGVH